MHADEMEERDFGGRELWDATPGVCCAYYQLGACAHTEADHELDESDEADTEPTDADPDREMVAFFPKQDQAIAFVERYNNCGRQYLDMTRKGRTVTWSVPEHEFTRNVYLMECLLGNVGYYGSAPQGKKATLNGRTAPASY